MQIVATISKKNISRLMTTLSPNLDKLSGSLSKLVNEMANNEDLIQGPRL